MIFWIILFMLIFTGMIFSSFLNSRDKKCYFQLLFVLITIIAVFRNNIGQDYYEYENYFYYATFDIYNIDREPLFLFICDYLRYFGFKAQAMFAVYATLTSLFMYKGCKYYSRGNWWIGIVYVSVYVLNNLLWYGSLNLIRQFLAVSIIFYASQFIFKNDIKRYLLFVSLAIFCHYSAVIGIILYPLKSLRLSKVKIIAITAFMLLVSSTNIFNYVIGAMFLIMGSHLGDYGSYFTDAFVRSSFLQGGTGLGVLLSCCTYLTALYASDEKDEIQRFCSKSVFCGLLLWIIFSLVQPMLRLRIYFFIFSPLLFAYNLKINIVKKPILSYMIIVIIIAMGMQSLYNISLIPNLYKYNSVNHNTNYNIDYFFTTDFR